MTPRECWLTAGLVASGVAFGANALWQQARYQDARDAVTRYVALDEREEKEDAEHAALLRQARPDIRTALANGEFDAALKRLRALETEDAEAAPEKTGPGLPLDRLWPPNSPERRKVQEVLRELVRKQAQGYDMAPAQNQLVEVADAARSGKKDRALAAFAEAASRVRHAALRPGFKAPADPPATRNSPAAAYARQEQEIRKLHAFRAQLSQVATAAAGGAEGPVLERLQALLDELIAAHEQKRDLRAVLVLTQPLGPAFQEARKSGDWSAIERRFGEVSAAVKAAPRFPEEALAAHRPSGGRSPAEPAAAPPNASSPEADKPAPPRMPSGANLPAKGSAENLLKALDMVRALPEADYQARRPMIAMFLAQAAGMERPGLPGGRISRGRPIPVGNDLQLLLTPDGGFAGMAFLGEPLSTGMEAAGATLHLEGRGDLPVRAPLVAQKEERLLRMEGPEGALSLLVSPAEGGVRLRMTARRKGEGMPGSLRLALPARLGGWRWSAGPVENAEPQVLAVDGEYRVQAAGGRLPKIVIRGAAADLVLEGLTATEAGYNGRTGRLWVRLPLPAGQPVIEHTVHLKAVKRP